jgi:hypothetical protein
MGTSMKINRSYGNGGSTGGGGTTESLQRLIEKEMVVTVGANTSLYIPVDVGFDRYEVRTVFVAPYGNTTYVLSMYDKQIDGNIIYRSLEESNTYDIINVPCEDKEGTQVLHCVLENKGSTSVDFRLIIRLTNFL